MDGKEPFATQYKDVPAIGLAPGMKAHIIAAENMTLSMARGEPNSHLPSHHHESEQILIVTDGAIDLVVEGVKNHLEKGDVIVLPSNVEHEGFVSDKGLGAIDIFSPPRYDFVARLEEAKKS
jgi:quercetin dioxygenase-like cupin family protein